MHTITLPQKRLGKEVSVTCVASVGESRLLVVCRAEQSYIMDFQGEIRLQFSSESRYGDFVEGVISTHQRFVYFISEKGFLLSFDALSARFEDAVQVSTRELYGIRSHPSQNKIAIVGADGYIYCLDS